MKLCRRCKEEKVLAEFPKDASRKDGKFKYCIQCCAILYRENKEKYAAQRAKYRAENKERISLRHAVWRKENTEKWNAASAKWRKEYPDKAKAFAAKWRESNLDKKASYTAKRRAQKLQATPVWANDFFIEEAYSLAQLRTKMLGYAWHVDHIVPLQHELVCGLHCEANLCVIPATENLSKGNRHWPDMPD